MVAHCINFSEPAQKVAQTEPIKSGREERRLRRKNNRKRFKTK